MAPKEEPGLVLQGVPKMIYADSGPISKSRVYRDVMSQCQHTSWHENIEFREPLDM